MGMSSRIQRIKSSRFSQRSKKQLEKGNEELGKTETNEKPIKKGKVVRKSSVTKIETRTQYILNKKNNVQKKRIVNKTKKNKLLQFNLPRENKQDNIIDLVTPKVKGKSTVSRLQNMLTKKKESDKNSVQIESDDKVNDSKKKSFSLLPSMSRKKKEKSVDEPVDNKNKCDKPVDNKNKCDKPVDNKNKCDK